MLLSKHALLPELRREGRSHRRAVARLPKLPRGHGRASRGHLSGSNQSVWRLRTRELSVGNERGTAAKHACTLARKVFSLAEPIIVGLNIFVCSLIFAPWVLPRETLSGLMGRWAATKTDWKYWVGTAGALVIDAIVFWEPDHCNLAYTLERRARMLR